MPGLNIPTNVVATVIGIDSPHVDYSITWNINVGVHPGPYMVGIFYSVDGGAYTQLEETGYLSSPLLQTTHLDAHLDSTYIYRVYWECRDCDKASGFGYSAATITNENQVSDTMTMTDEVTVSEIGAFITDTMTMSDTVNSGLDSTVTDTVTMTDTVSSAATLKTDYAYYLGDDTGKVYEYSSNYGSFNGSPIQSYIKIKKTDFSDVFPVAADRVNTAYRAWLTYIDKGQHFVTFYYSTDGGVTYKGVGKTIGTTAASGMAKVALFDFVATGQFFNFKVESSTTTGTFQWIGLQIDFVVGGEFFEI